MKFFSTKTSLLPYQESFLFLSYQLKKKKSSIGIQSCVLRIYALWLTYEYCISLYPRPDNEDVQVPDWPWKLQSQRSILIFLVHLVLAI